MKSELVNINFNLEFIFHNNSVEIESIFVHLESIFVKFKVPSAQVIDQAGEVHLFYDSCFIEFHDGVKIPARQPIIWSGNVDLRKSQVKDFIDYVSSNTLDDRSSVGLFWRFNGQMNHDRDETSVDKLPFDPSIVTSFSFGNIVNFNRFVAHFDSLNGFNKTAKTSSIGKTTVELNSSKKQLVLNFNTRSNKESAQISTRFKLIYELGKIKDVKIHRTLNDEITLYIHHTNAPKIFSQIANTKSGKRSNDWTRRRNCDLISQDILGKCSVLRLAVEAEGSSYLSVMYKWRQYHPLDFLFGEVKQFRLMRKHANVFTKLPFKIKYALDCIKSLNYNFQDDLCINHKGEKVINGLIESYIADDQVDLIVEALYCLFNDYTYDRVYYAYEHFKLLIARVGTEWKHFYETERTKCVRTAIITPTRTIFTPPVAVHRNIMFNQTGPNLETIRVVLRDEDSTKLCPSVFGCLYGLTMNEAMLAKQCIDAEYYIVSNRRFWVLRNIKKVLLKILPFTQLHLKTLLAEKRLKTSTPFTIDAPKASMLMVSVVIGVRNRLRSIYFKR